MNKYRVIESEVNKITKKNERMYNKMEPYEKDMLYGLLCMTNDFSLERINELSKLIKQDKLNRTIRIAWVGRFQKYSLNEGVIRELVSRGLLPKSYVDYDGTYKIKKYNLGFLSRDKCMYLTQLSIQLLFDKYNFNTIEKNRIPMALWLLTKGIPDPVIDYAILSRDNLITVINAMKRCTNVVDLCREILTAR